MTDSAGAASADTLSGVNRTMGIAVQAARQGAADASEAAARAWSATNLVMAKIVYSASYTIAFGVVFPLAFIAQSIPRNNAAIRGLIEGAEAASQRVDRLLGQSPSV
jgi:hypothetical protein